MARNCDLGITSQHVKDLCVKSRMSPCQMRAVHLVVYHKHIYTSAGCSQWWSNCYGKLSSSHSPAQTPHKDKSTHSLTAKVDKIHVLSIVQEKKKKSAFFCFFSEHYVNIIMD